MCVAAVAAEAVALPLYGAAFGGPLVGLLAVRAALTIVLVAFTWRGSAVGRAVLGGLRLMAGLVGVVMATIVDGTGLVAGVAALGIAEILLGSLLFIKLAGQKGGGG